MQSIEEDVTFIRGYRKEYQDLSSTLQHPNPRAMIHWVPPPPSWVKFAKEMGFMQVVLESDLRTVIQKFQANKEDYSNIRSITWDVRVLARNFLACRFEFVARGGNSAAHAMAMRSLENHIWVKDALSRVSELADSDHHFQQPS
ncbi:hypothetical protein PVK06_034408 [Gossypium arboreum]|uniref:RNase H type-1 domain-containing protein n=1 Tax=Gossypium arboreum TaxID=29729 RepID=A0ABR0NE57_GOSAR|nr:hypothetical protein PVK06_034408 [Gossypium arboreum]